jgi:hypothetical protein
MVTGNGAEDFALAHFFLHDVRANQHSGLLRVSRRLRGQARSIATSASQSAAMPTPFFLRKLLLSRELTLSSLLPLGNNLLLYLLLHQLRFTQLAMQI